MSRPAHLRPELVALVAVGGAVGTAARLGVTQVVRPADGWPTATFVENLLGAFLLGLLLEALVRAGVSGRRATVLRLTLGTGLLGGFTTFSAVAIEIERLIAEGRGVLGAAYGLASVLLGLGACLAGVVVAARWPGRTVPPQRGQEAP